MAEHPGVVFKDGLPVAAEPDPAVRFLVEGITLIDAIWKLMRPTNAPAPLRRSMAGPKRDFDYNLYGLAHYGMLPDMLQDLKNVGLPTGVMDRFFGSAQRYVEVWEKCAQAAARIPHPTPGGP